MSSIHHATESGSNTSTPRSCDGRTTYTTMQPSYQTSSSVRLMCSFGGKIVPRPFNGRLRYFGGDTRIVAVDRRTTTFASLTDKLSKICGAANGMCLKYQLPNEDLDALITVTSGEDVESMMEEYDRLLAYCGAARKPARLRLFVFVSNSVTVRHSDINVCIINNNEAGSGLSKSEQWFIDALNCGPGPVRLDRGRSEISSVVSDVPDYFSENFDERPRLKNKKVLPDGVSNSDPGSPFSPTAIPDLRPVKTRPDKPDNSGPESVPGLGGNSGSPFSPIVIPDLRPVKTRPDNPDNPGHALEPKGTPTESISGSRGNSGQQFGYPGSPFSQPVPVYYVTGPFQPIGAPYVHQQLNVNQGQATFGFSHPGFGMTRVQDEVSQAKPLDNHSTHQLKNQ